MPSLTGRRSKANANMPVSSSANKIVKNGFFNFLSLVYPVNLMLSRGGILQFPKKKLKQKKREMSVLERLMLWFSQMLCFAKAMAYMERTMNNDKNVTISNYCYRLHS